MENKELSKRNKRRSEYNFCKIPSSKLLLGFKNSITVVVTQERDKREIRNEK